MIAVHSLLILVLLAATQPWQSYEVDPTNAADNSILLEKTVGIVLIKLLLLQRQLLALSSEKKEFPALPGVS
jgi:hypothetical protein